MIILNGKTLPNVEYYFKNNAHFHYPKDSANPIFYGMYQHSGSGITASNGDFSVELYPTDYHIQIGYRHNTIIYYKDLNSGTDGSNVDFGNSRVYLSGTNWL